MRDWEELGRVGAVRKLVPSIAEAVGQYLTDCRARLRPASVKKYRSLTETHLLRFCAARGFTRLEQLDVVASRDFRNSWTFAPVTQSKNLEYLRGFMKFCLLSGWIPTNPAVSVKSPRVPHIPTLPFSEPEFQKLLKGCTKQSINGARLRALILLLRYSGLRISDAVRLKRSEVRNGRVFLYQEKTGTPVNVPIPSVVQAALKSLHSEGEHFFWSGRGALSTGIETMRRGFYALAESTGVENAHFHRLRDTFAVNLLLAGVPIDQVSVLLGHNSVKVTEKHYSPWIKARQDQLEAAVRRTWRRA